MSPMPTPEYEERLNDLRRKANREGNLLGRSASDRGAARVHPGLPDPRVLEAPVRFAVVSGVRSRSDVEPYLPENYELVSDHDADPDGRTKNCVIQGADVAGWTLDDYVIPRLASGNIFCREHPTLNDAETAACAAMN